MNRYALGHLQNHDVAAKFHSLIRDDRVTTADLIAYLGEFDERKLYLPEAHASMFSYCVGDLCMSEDTALKRIRVARIAREFSAIFPALVDGRLNLTSVLLLKPYLTRENSDELLVAAANKTSGQIEHLLAERLPKADLPTLVVPQPHANGALEVAARPLPDFEKTTVVAPPGPPTSSAAIAPIAPQRYAIQATVSQATHDKLRHAQALLGHAVPSGDLAQVLDRALDALIARLEQRKFAAAIRTRPRNGQPRGRYVPAEFRRKVWERDGGRCTFVSARGKRCEERTRLEFDHVDLVARGGQASVDGLRLRCRAHNQYGAEQALGAGFMRRKREEARAKAAQAKSRKRAEAAHAGQDDVIRCLRGLGFRADEARLGAAHSAQIADASLEQRVRVALSALAPRCVRSDPAGPAANSNVIARPSSCVAEA